MTYLVYMLEAENILYFFEWQCVGYSIILHSYRPVYELENDAVSWYNPCEHMSQD